MIFSPVRGTDSESRRHKSETTLRTGRSCRHWAIVSSLVARFLAVGMLAMAAPTTLRAVGVPPDSAAEVPVEEAPTHDTVAIERNALEVFVDAFFTDQMEPLHTPGASLAIVQDGKIVLAKGFGWADLAKRTPVIADRTLFDVQSVSKLFTITAVMQATERGFVKLDEDVNRYLKTFQVEPTFSQPVRLFDLMTHTSGLEDQGVGITARRESDWLPLGQYLARSLPGRVRPPGRTMLYSDCGICLAGYVVESATGVPLAQFMKENILQPLEMQRTHFLKLPAELQPDLATGYSFEHGQYKALPHDYYNIWASSSLMTTATDMSHFLIAHLQDGRYHGARILSEEGRVKCTAASSPTIRACPGSASISSNVFRISNAPSATRARAAAS